MADQKESFWFQRNSAWPTEEEVPSFEGTTKSFMGKCELISKRVCKSIPLSNNL